MTVYTQASNYDRTSADIDALYRQTEALISRIIPGRCRARVRGLFSIKHPYWTNLNAACNRVINWSQSVFTSSKRSFYLYGKEGPMGLDGDDVKPDLIEVGCRCVTLYSAIETGGYCGPAWRRVSIEDLLKEDTRRRFEQLGRKTEYSIPVNGGKVVTFDGYIDYLAQEPVLFIKDVGHGETRGMVRAVLEDLVLPRARRGLPTFYSSDHSIGDLEDVFGAWLVGQMIANGCDQVDVREAA